LSGPNFILKRHGSWEAWHHRTTKTWFDCRLKRQVVRPMVKEVGCQARRHFSPGERFSMSKKWVVRPVSSFSRQETTHNCSLCALGNSYRALRLPVWPVVEAPRREVR
jgi:hypothetical protein